MKQFFIALLLLVSFVGYSQDSHLGLNMGPSFPIGDFSKSDDYKTQGYAQPGFNLSFAGNYIPTWYFGIGGALVFGTNFPNQDSMLSGLINELREMEALPEIPEEVDASFTIGNWSYVNVMVGPTFSYPAGKLQFNLKALIGMSIVMPPTQTLNLMYDNNTISGYSDTQNVSFCYDFGTDIILKLSGSYSLIFGVDYFHSSTEYDVEIGYNDNQLPAISRKIEINTVHTTVGFAYLL